MYPDGMNLYAAYHVLHGGLDPSGLLWVDTGLRVCEGGMHEYIKLKNGRGYGHYAESHVGGNASWWDDIKAAGVVDGVIVNNDHRTYPRADCKKVMIDNCCVDYKKFIAAIEEHVKDRYNKYNLRANNRTDYNVAFNNCYTFVSRSLRTNKTFDAILEDAPAGCLLNDELYRLVDE